MTQDEFVDRWIDEMVGLLVTAFEREATTHGDLSAKGREVMNQMRRARSLLKRMAQDIEPKPVPPAQPKGVK